jgi:integrase
MRRVVLYSAMKTAGIERGDRTHGFHILRHTAASLLRELTGGNLKSVQEFVRHSQIGTTADVYVHRENTQREQAVNYLPRRCSVTLKMLKF